jgi:phosphate acetyltransferase
MKHSGKILQGYIERARRAGPLITAVVHPCDAESLGGALAAAKAGLIVPILVGPLHKIRSAAAAGGFDIRKLRLVSTEHSHAAAAAAVGLVRSGEAQAIMKGSLHTDELMSAVVDSAAGLRTGRRMSHVFVMDAPLYPRALLITDAAINIEPDLDTKRDIVQNAIDLARVLGIRKPKVAVLAAVEMVNSRMRSTLDAAALCKMADRGQITGGIVDGPLAFDNAISPAALKEKHIVSAVAGRADILMVPDIEAGNMLAKQLYYFGNAQSAGVVLGARVPVMLTSRADPIASRVASCAVASLLAHSTRGAGAPGKAGK